MPSKANCPNCGAEITFRWSSAIQTTCPFCRSILVRHDVDLRRVGVASDIPPSTSAIQLGTEGRYKGTPFTVVGRIVYEYDRGRWNEWHLRLADGTSAWLSDALAEYAVSRQLASPPELPSAAELRVGQSFGFDGTLFKVMTITRARYGGVEGELPFEYWDKSEILFADLESKSDRFATLDYSEPEPLLFVGEYEEFDELELSNLREIAGW
jgi:Domain of unknown function (DUF4178)